MYLQRNVLKQSGDSKIVLCIDAMDQSDYAGRLYNHVDCREVPFNGLTELLKLIEEILARIKFPQPAHAYHRFQQEKEKTEAGERFPLPGDVQIEDVEPGQLATYMVQVQFRQNATWMGLFFDNSERRPQRFHSVLELIRLIDAALQRTAE